MSARRRPTIVDVAQAAGVSKGAVSFALNGRPGVGQATRRRILAAAHELGFRPSVSARALARRQAFAFGLVLRRDATLLSLDPFFPRFIAGVEEALSPQGYALTLQVVGEDAVAERAAYQALAAGGRVDAVFLLDLRQDEYRFALLEELALPALAVGRPHQSATPLWLAVDDRPGVTAAVRHLAELGHRVIGHVGGAMGYVHTADRRAAWLDTLRAAGLPEGPLEYGDFSAEGGAAATRRLLAGPVLPTAIVYANDLMALAGLSVLREVGLRVPDDVSVVGFDDVPLAAHVDPALTTVMADVEAWGRQAAASLLAIYAGEHPEVGYLGDSRLVVRSSTDPPPRR